ncbi:glutathione S-transferase omega-1-like [Sycon ciliatum]|uniref:glutathione S-transferase omega-1-like n=1 Tax=Sycon ciliatum TaxID=27933 RepID=UPI0031F68560
MPGEDSVTLYGYETLRGSPPPTDKPIRVISMEYCPFAESSLTCQFEHSGKRARMVLAKKGLEHDIINVDLSNKPAFLFEANPNGQVPGCFTRATTSTKYLENKFPETATLYPKDATVRAQGRQLSSQHGSKVIPAFYKTVSSLKSEDPAVRKEAFANFHKVLDTWVEQKLGDGPFFGGATENITDILIWPWLYRSDILTRHRLPELLNADKFPKTLRYIAAMRALPYIQQTAATDEGLLKFVDTFTSGKKPVGYNIDSKHPFYAGPASADA